MYRDRYVTTKEQIFSFVLKRFSNGDPTCEVAKIYGWPRSLRLYLIEYILGILHRGIQIPFLHPDLERYRNNDKT
jgi:hypothetical protein